MHGYCTCRGESRRGGGADTWAAKQRSLLRVLSAAVAERIEFAPLVLNLAADHRGRYRRRLYRLARRLASGTPLVDALEQTPDVLSDSQVLALRFGSQSGTLAQSLQNLLDDRNTLADRAFARLRQAKFYFVFVLMIGGVVLSFWLMKIAPEMHKIFDDFDLELPEVTRLVIEVSRVFVNYWWAFALAFLAVAWVFKSGRTRRYFRRNHSSRLLRPILQLRSANLLMLLAVALKAGRPMPGAVSTLARYHFDRTIRNKLLFVRNEIEQGADLWASLAETRLLSNDESQAIAIAPTTESRALDDASSGRAKM